MWYGSNGISGLAAVWTEVPIASLPSTHTPPYPRKEEGSPAAGCLLISWAEKTL